MSRTILAPGLHSSQDASDTSIVLPTGLIDTACPPSSVWAAYNALGGPKRMHVDVTAGHTNTAEAGAATTEAVRQHFAVMTTGRPRVDVA